MFGSKFFLMPISFCGEVIRLTIKDQTFCIVKKSNQLEFKIAGRFCERTVQKQTRMSSRMIFSLSANLSIEVTGVKCDLHSMIWVCLQD